MYRLTLVKDAVAAADGTDGGATAAAAVGRNRPAGGSRGNMGDVRSRETHCGARGGA